MKPIISASGKIAQLRYELPHRIHDSTVYPVKAPNGSSILLYAHETGVGVAWRGGRPIKKNVPASKQPAKPAKVNGTNDAIMIIDSDDDEPAKASASEPVADAEFEDDEEELDPDQPYPSIVQHLSLILNTEVVHIAVPHIPAVTALRPADSIPAIFAKKIVFTVACADSTVRIITLPLSPPTDAAKARAPAKGKPQLGEDIVRIHGHQGIARGVTMTWTSRSAPTYKVRAEDDMDVVEEDNTATMTARNGQEKTEQGFDLLVASHSTELGGALKIWRFQLKESGLDVKYPIAPYRNLSLRKPASRVVFSPAQYPKRRHSQLLIADLAGTARIYDLFASKGRRRMTEEHAEMGAFVATFRSPFESVKSTTHTPAILAGRKSIIDATWASDGHHALILLTDGEWGIWDVNRSGPSPPEDPSTFSLRAFVGTAEKEGSGNIATSPKRASRSSLAPMTPNTRRRKEETLFQGSSSSSTVAPRGGISVASRSTATGAAPEDSVIIWYGSEIHRISDLAKFWTRTAAAAGGNSLPGPGLSQIQDISLHGETITSITQFDTTAEAARLARPRDLLISAEHRLLINTTTTHALGRDLTSMFANEEPETEESKRSDQALLSHGELDLGGMDRLLDDMEGSATVSKSLTLGNPRRVLFASSAA